MHNFLKSLLKTAEEGTLLNSFNETTIPKYQNKTKISHTKKKKREREKKNYRLISLTNIDVKILNKMLANKIQKYIKRIIHHDQVGFTPWMQVFFNICKSISMIHHISKLKNLFNRCRKFF